MPGSPQSFAYRLFGIGTIAASESRPSQAVAIDSTSILRELISVKFMTFRVTLDLISRCLNPNPESRNVARRSTYLPMEFSLGTGTMKRIADFQLGSLAVSKLNLGNGRRRARGAAFWRGTRHRCFAEKKMPLSTTD